MKPCAKCGERRYDYPVAVGLGPKCEHCDGNLCFRCCEVK